MKLSEFIKEFDPKQKVQITSKEAILYDGTAGELDILVNAVLVKRGSKLENDKTVIEVVKW